MRSQTKEQRRPVRACPECQGQNLVPQGVQVGACWTMVRLSCTDCSLVWDEIYALAGRYCHPRRTT